MNKIKIGEIAIDNVRCWNRKYEVILNEPIIVDIYYDDSEEYFITDDVTGFCGFSDLLFEAMDDYLNNLANGCWDAMGKNERYVYGDELRDILVPYIKEIKEGEENGEEVSNNSGD